MSTFWYGSHYVEDDSLNQMIWSESPRVQTALQPPATLRSAGLFGAQQAMNDAGIVPGVDEKTILPWVPDLVGRNSGTEDGLLVIGTAYAGFIREYSSRGGIIPLSTYYAHATALKGYADFQRSFVKSVVSGDQNYYEKIASLMIPAGFHDASQITLFDLCRASFVLRVGPPGPRKDDSQSAATCCWPIFQQYVETAEPRGWLWRRIAESPARRIIALGYTAEHGLLRLFESYSAFYKMKIHRRRAESPVSWRSKFGPYEPWAKNYADEDKKIKWWLSQSDWWEIDTEKEAPCWRVLPISHPARASDYGNLGQVLREMQ